MKKCACMLISIGLSVAFAAGQDLEEKETIQKVWSFAAGSGPAEVRVDNIEGFIRVEGYGGRDIELTAEKTIRARSAEEMAAAKSEVQLLLTQKGNVVEAYVDAPGRCEHRSDRRRRHYRVIYDFRLRVPYDAKLQLETVNHGKIEVRETQGDFEVHNVNGAISMLEVGGSGSARTVNGAVEVAFRANPASDCSFGTINGDIDVTFPPGLAADFLLKTFHGGVYSDFPVTPLPADAATVEERSGMKVYHAGRFTGVRVGRGGPEIRLDGFNSDLRIHQKD